VNDSSAVIAMCLAAHRGGQQPAVPGGRRPSPVVRWHGGHQSQLQRAIEILIEELDESADRWRERVCERLVLHRVGLSRSVVTTGTTSRFCPHPRADRPLPLSAVQPPADLVRADLGELSAECKGTAVAGRIVDGRLVPYYARAEIEAGALGASAPVIAWLDDPIELFFLHIQAPAFSS